MDSRFSVALILCVAGIGFAAGYIWPRNPVDEPNAKRLLSVTDTIASDVTGIQRTLERGVTQCPSDPISVPVGGAAETKNRAPVALEVEDNRQQRAQAEAIVIRGVSAGRWTDEDARELRAAMSELSGDQKQEVITSLLQAINAQQVKLEVGHGGVL